VDRQLQLKLQELNSIKKQVHPQPLRTMIKMLDTLVVIVD